MNSPVYRSQIQVLAALFERKRLEHLAQTGQLKIIARREIIEVKSYDDYALESVETNKRIFAKYGAAPGAKPPMHETGNI